MRAGTVPNPVTHGQSTSRDPIAKLAVLPTLSQALMKGLKPSPRNLWQTGWLPCYMAKLPGRTPGSSPTLQPFPTLCREQLKSKGGASGDISRGFRLDFNCANATNSI